MTTGQIIDVIDNPPASRRAPAFSVAQSLERIANVLEGLACLTPLLERIADRLDPPAADKVGSPYVAAALSCTTVWVAEMARTGKIPPSCIVAGTGNGKPWRFHRRQIDAWLQSR